MSAEHGLRKVARKASTGGEDGVHSISEKEAESRGGTGAMGERKCWNTAVQTAAEVGRGRGRQQKKILFLLKPSLN